MNVLTKTRFKYSISVIKAGQFWVVITTVGNVELDPVKAGMVKDTWIVQVERCGGSSCPERATAGLRLSPPADMVPDRQ